MNGGDYRDYFLQPGDVTQRRYEALRSVFVEEQAMQTVAARFDVSYGTVRNWASEFRRGCDAGHAPPFSLRCEAVPPPAKAMTKNPKSKRPTCGRCPSKPDAAWLPGTRASSCSCRCWHSCVSIDSSPRPTIPDRKWFPPPMPCSVCSRSN